MVFFAPAILAMVIVLINPFTGYVFKIDKDKGYLRGHGIWLIYTIMIMYLLLAVIFAIVYRKVMGKFKLCCIELFVVVTIFHMLIQYYYPKELIEGFGGVLCLLILYAGVYKPEMLVDGRFGTYNLKAFMDKGKMYFNMKIPFSIISVSVEDSDYLEKVFGVETMSGLEVEIARYLNKKVDRYDIYRVSDYMFYIVIREENDDENKEKIRILTEEISAECDRSWHIGEVEIPVVFKICVVKCLEDVSDINELFTCTSYFAKEYQDNDKHIVYVGEYESFRGKRKSKIKKAIGKAIKNKSFQVYYQPIFSTVSGKVDSAEALVRLNDDELGFISPEEFIPIAEEDGSIVEIDDFVLEEVCKFIKENNIKEKGIKYIEVNVSVIECMKRDMAKRVAEKIKKYGLEPGQINLEITETATVNSPQMLGINMNKLVDGGTQFSLDDYGTGNSNINYLIDLPFYIIKIDKNIVWSSFKNEKAGIALDSSIQMIKKLGFHIVAEGVESKEQAMRLMEMGCDYLQGYYYSKPLCEGEFLNYING
jgi:EAL domain-containing protein (putative c-di-GMP-specific phosphodiesterase class I)